MHVWSQTQCLSKMQCCLLTWRSFIRSKLEQGSVKFHGTQHTRLFCTIYSYFCTSTPEANSCKSHGLAKPKCILADPLQQKKVSLSLNYSVITPFKTIFLVYTFYYLIQGHFLTWFILFHCKNSWKSHTDLNIKSNLSWVMLGSCHNVSADFFHLLQCYLLPATIPPADLVLP